MYIRVLGNGSAFNPELTNTSFIVNDTVLIDCGYNVFPKLLKEDLVSDIKYVVITHLHADHVGSLGALVYYKEFVLKEEIYVLNLEYSQILLRELVSLKTLSPLGFHSVGDTSYVKFCGLDMFNSVLEENADLKVLPIKHYGHIVCPVFAFLIRDGKGKVAYFTGDTMLIPLHKIVCDIALWGISSLKVQSECAYQASRINSFLDKNMGFIMFHDSETEKVPSMIHARLDDIKAYYGELISGGLVVPVHNDLKELEDKEYHI